jgi:hypothetical protein
MHVADDVLGFVVVRPTVKGDQVAFLNRSQQNMLALNVHG